jgi:hypothetical protein
MNQLAFPVTPANTNMTHGAFLHDPRPIGNGTYTSWPGGVDPSVPLYAGNPVPLSMNTTQSGGKRMGYRKNSRKANRKNSRKANRKNSRKANRKNSRKANRKTSRKANRKNSRKNNRRN